MITIVKLKERWRASTLLILLLMIWQVHANATLISLETTTLNLSQNQQFTIDLWARGVGTDVVSGFDVDISIDNAAVLFQSATFSSLLGDGIDSIQEVTDSGSIINLAELSFLFEDELLALQGGADFILVSFTFLVDQIGSAQISISNSLLTGADTFSAAFSGSANSLTFDISAAQVAEPQTGLLFVLSLLAGRLMRKTTTKDARKAQ